MLPHNSQDILTTKPLESIDMCVGVFLVFFALTLLFIYLFLLSGKQGLALLFLLERISGRDFENRQTCLLHSEQ